MARRKTRYKKGQTVGLGVIILGLLIFIASYLFPELFTEGTELTAISDADCSVHFIDVGQGDCALIRSDGYNILIDSGEKEYAADVVRYLNEQSIERLDMVVVSHPHSDHMGGMSDIIKQFDVGQILLNRLPDDLTPTTKTYTDFLEVVKDKGLKLTASKVGQEYNFGKGMLTVLGPIEQFDDLNNTSIVAEFDYGGNEFLFTGDMEKQSESALLDAGTDLGSSVLKVAHHGSNTSSTKAFLSKVNPKIAVIGVGADNKYGHPQDKVIQRLEELECDIYRTDRNGTVVIEFKEGEVYVSCERSF